MQFKHIPSSGLVVSIKTKGCATEITCECKPKDKRKSGHKCTITPHQTKSTPNKRANTSHHSFSANQLFLLGLLNNGLGFSDGISLCGYLGLKKPWSTSTYRIMETKVASNLLNESSNIINENLTAEIEASELYSNGKVKLTAFFDMGWQQRQCGNKYNSNSGHAFLVGVATKKIIGLTIFCKKCAMCTYHENKNTTPPFHYCPRNHFGSSKSMESLSAVQLLQMMYENKNVSIDKLVGDDDSTFRSKIKHSYKAKVESNEGVYKDYTKDDWPTYVVKKGKDKGKRKKVKDNGILPLHVPEVSFVYTDPTHRTKVAVKGIFNKANSTKANNRNGITKQDAERIKVNFGYFLKLYSTKSIEEMMRRSKAILEHHFNNHEFCGKWCKWSTENESIPIQTESKVQV